MIKKDAVIIGCGVVGAGIAYQLALRGLKPIVLEKGDQVAAGSTGKSSAVVRQHYSNKETSTMAFEALQLFKNWSDFTGLKETRVSFKQTGVLWFLKSRDKTLDPCVNMMREVGIKVEVLDSNQIREMFPDLSTCGIKFSLDDPLSHRCKDMERASFETEAGYADPVGTTQDLIEAAKRCGAELSLKDEVTEICVENGKIVAVIASKSGRIEAPIVISAAGPWAERINRLAGYKLPVNLYPTRSQIVLRTIPEKLQGEIPVVGDLINEIYFRPEAGGQQILIGSVNPDDEEEVINDPDDFDDFADKKFKEDKLHLIHHRIKSFKYKGDITSYAAPYTVNKLDWHPVIDRTEIDGFYVTVGFSGHGFKLAPIVGMMVAELVMGTKDPKMKTSIPADFFARNRKPIETFLGGGVVG